MGWTKRQFIAAAFGELGLSLTTFELNDDQLSEALTRLDSMMALWDSVGIRLGCSFNSSSGIDDTTPIPDFANEAVFMNLAVRVAPSYGKAVHPDTRELAKSGYENLLRISSQFPQELKLTGLPVGAGNKPVRSSINFLDVPTESIDAGMDNQLDFD